MRNRKPLAIFCTIICSVITLVVTNSFFISPAFSQSEAVYYVDCNNGNDLADGTSVETAWKTLAKANTAILEPGNKLLLKNGCIWTESLRASWSGTQENPILISSYGEGNLPLILNANRANVTITGSFQIIENIQASHEGTPTTPVGCRLNIGWKLGVSLDSNAHHNTVRKMVIKENAVGVNFGDETSNNKILNNYIVDNKYAYDINPTIGMMGVLLHGSDNEVAYNKFESTNVTQQGVLSCVYQDNSIELYRAQRSFIHHNTSLGDRVFSEMGSNKNIPDDISVDNIYAYNVHYTTASNPVFVNTRGTEHEFGPVWRTKLYNNTLYHPGTGTSGSVICSYCSPELLTLKNNIIWSNGRAIYAGVGDPEENNNIFWADDSTPELNGITLDATSKQVDPQFINRAALDFNLQSTSPAIDAGTDVGSFIDRNGVAVPQGAAPDMGAYEYVSPVVTPTPTFTTTPTSTPSPEPTFTPTPTATSTPIATPTATTSPLPTTTPIITKQFVPIADTFVRSDTATTNYGTKTYIQTVGGTNTKIGYLKFNLTSLAGKNIKSAKLRMYITNDSKAVHSVKAVADTAWSETGLTYKNRPPMGSTITTFTPGTAINVWAEATVTTGIIGKEGNLVTLAIDTTGTDTFDFNSREYATTSLRPVLIIEY